MIAAQETTHVETVLHWAIQIDSREAEHFFFWIKPKNFNLHINEPLQTHKCFSTTLPGFVFKES